AVAHRAILRKQNISVAMSVGGHRGLPLIAGGVADTLLRSEIRNRKRRLYRRQRQQQAHSKLGRTPGIAGSTNHRLLLGQRLRQTLDALYREWLHSVNCPRRL